ncbi:ATP-dependent helicase [Actinorhabdospora filicis]|uniref:ATP-dependent helicase n=2 Tax=Actinorhabdospora filicis TaxID=1785913 RepID=A0A9W6SKP1_9ACTN|nr:ATP-dependent helicase [Actinorhabdospora filicis]
MNALLDAAIAAVPGGQVRPGQQQMAAAIDRARETGSHLLVQAGTGTGKSIGYLVPSLLSDRPVVVSTATLALQAQLVDTDLPRLADATEGVLGRRPSFAVLKGRHHYLCAAKLASPEAEDEQDTLDGGSWLGQASKMEKHVTRLHDWANDTETGDRDELDPGVPDVVWRGVSVSARECPGAMKCAQGDICFAEKARGQAREADIVVTNHSLLSIDLLNGRKVLPEHDLLIVDEAHELADRATGAAQAEVTVAGIERVMRRAGSFVSREVKEKFADAGAAFDAALMNLPPGRLTQIPAAMREALTLLEGACREGASEITVGKDEESVTKQQAKTGVTDLRDVVQRFLLESEHDVIWGDGEGRRRQLTVAPLSVAGILGQELFAERTVVATSATLTLGGKFDSAARSLGLDEGDYDTLDVGSPFEYRKQGILYVASHLPKPGMSGLSEAAADELVRLVTALGGRTLGLFSSRKAAERAAEVLRERTDLPILLQGEESLAPLVRRFRAEPETCLLGVMSLWQGVDVPGDSCQLVVVDRLPFPRPDEPLTAARSAAADNSGGSGFAQVSVPYAAIRLAQGVGRLIRSVDDKGVVAVLDPRLETARSYGRYLRESLPPLWYTTDKEKVAGALSRLKAAS